MQLFKYIDRINLLDKLIRQRRTGTPSELAKRLGISVSRLYVMLDELKGQGAPIEYSRQSCTYLYTHEFMISISFKIETLGDDKLRYISGGTVFPTASEAGKYLTIEFFKYQIY
ncbi:HTH domain-containing protein [Sphingobacterium prati]|uniref:HTH domain-containing protein n=1 Tax=Sphingobacterium prati TaxID=2737006 RepID=UPI0015574EE7|nr:HTH domain-containing protein [Sphingobacterium prati]NPE44891.1 HTH domain-containing protein [Sphingobacterium prati]